MTQATQCIDCNRFKLDGTCTAYPLGIPDEIFSGEFDHSEAFPGDDGIRSNYEKDFDDDADWKLFQERQKEQILTAPDDKVKELLRIMGLDHMTVEQLRSEFKDD